MGLVAYSVAVESSRAQTGGTPEGGLFDLLEPDGKQRHHMPAANSQEEEQYNSGCGPAIRMDPEDHFDTASHGQGLKHVEADVWMDADDYRNMQRVLIEEGSFREAIDMDIRNIRFLFGDKYDVAIEQMLAAYERIKDSFGSLEANRLLDSNCDPPPPPPTGGGAEEPAPAPALSLTARQSQLHAFMEWEYPEQQVTGEPGTPPGPVQAVFDLEVTRHPDVAVGVQIAWGDGTTTYVPVPAGTGTYSTPLSHDYAAPDTQGGKGSYRAEARYAYQQAVIPPGWEDEHPIAASLIGIETC